MRDTLGSRRDRRRAKGRALHVLRNLRTRAKERAKGGFRISSFPFAPFRFSLLSATLVLALCHQISLTFGFPVSFVYAGLRFQSHEAESYDEFNDRYQLFFDQAPDLFELQVSSFFLRFRCWKEGGSRNGKKEAM